ncbi:hypothetical protein SAMN04488047_103117 [Tranquillimonas alkanivorans]|uniref:AAA+ family ATPase n=2 Tax=Tranquillimonas alkanivorans TaxID=441119 RepID=A0A1I5N6D0_9RHOB|nr:hypothetical protein SAMN04488047_103117 [Tranquillimonas alkanivorans]
MRPVHYIRGMIRTLLITLALAAPLPLAAQEAPRQDMEEGVDLLSEGARTLLRGLLDEVEPHMREMAEALEGWDLEGLSVDDLTNYHAPEVLPNGDIIIRRKTPLAPDEPPFPRDPESEIEL